MLVKDLPGEIIEAVRSGKPSPVAATVAVPVSVSPASGYSAPVVEPVPQAVPASANPNCVEDLGYGRTGSFGCGG